VENYKKNIADAVTCSETEHTSDDLSVAKVKGIEEPVTSSLLSLFMIPTSMESGNMPRILVSTLTHTVMLDGGAQVSVLTLQIIRYFQPLIQIPNNKFEVRTSGSSNDTLRMPVPLPIHTYGVKVPHLFYFVDADVSALIRHDRMRVARLVVDVDNRRVWSRRDGSSTPGPNPPDSVATATIQACVSFFEGSYLPVIEEEDEVDDDVSLPRQVDETSTAVSEVDVPTPGVDKFVPSFFCPPAL